MATMALAALGRLLALGPVLFGIGFMAPVLAELMLAAGIPAPFGLPPIAVGLAVGLAWGTYAYRKGRWI